MKFFHLSDLHIGLKLINRDLREDQEYILQEITDIAVREQPGDPLRQGLQGQPLPLALRFHSAPQGREIYGIRHSAALAFLLSNRLIL